ncbi:MarR family transcriptional regulator [Nocardia terpenica]|uniref:Uncharacterized protein n=1 Tax=Nocardia terpenica TaxID=455432 RepID=A0A164JUS7_9NOCA|nr:MarR family transcriptional regulator [Nocardia terpenica]KZM70741.1 hypothetical protein AWN90_39980 [Nocardia terpenica]NQE89993.1 MarR family transcriptional regulator [Nocardia terpenica]
MGSRYFFDEQAAVLAALANSPDPCTAAELAHLTGLPVDGRARPSVPAILALLEQDNMVRRGRPAWMLTKAAPANPAAGKHQLTGTEIRALLTMRDVPWPRTSHGLARATGGPYAPMTRAVHWLARHRPQWVESVPTWHLDAGIPMPGKPAAREGT